MDTRSITEAAVSTAVTKALSRIMPSNPGESSRGSNSASEGDCTRRKWGPSGFLAAIFDYFYLLPLRTSLATRPYQTLTIKPCAHSKETLMSHSVCHMHCTL